MPQNALPGQYFLRVLGRLEDGSGGNIFFNETEIEFDSKQASLFIMMSKPMYRQGQMGE